MERKTLLDIPGYTYNEYKLVLHPNEDLSEKIQKLQTDFRQEHQVKDFSSKPALTLATFVQFEVTEMRLMHRIESICNKWRPFKVELNGFGSLPSHTIYFNIESKETLQKLVKEIRSLQKLLTVNQQNKPHFLRDPHFLLAGKLTPAQYEKSWPYFSQKDFTSRFVAEELTLLKRPLLLLADNQKFQVYRKAGTFKFQNLPEPKSQGRLFL